ncbi:MAG: pre-16S rRNA-processing nuclease YqgF [Veillonellaceae bacterium]|nr:pre-16S rRNA-processing nuclease YqgF [Veillonellaceae bacterium]
MEPPILAIDPGREKCGVAVMDQEKTVLWHGVVATADLLPVGRELARQYGFHTVILGNQTYSGEIHGILQSLLDSPIVLEIIFVDERGSTEAARSRYWQAFPPTGWRRFLPRGLLVPPCAIDDFAAIILGERFLAKKS